MSSKVILINAKIKTPLVVLKDKIKGNTVYVFEKEFQMELNTNKGVFLWTVEHGYISNGGSIPWVGQKVLRVKSFDSENMYQNAFFFFCMTTFIKKKGYGIFDRDDCDALCRGGLREAGCSRFQASTIDFFLKLGAWGHWGDNSYGNFEFLSSLKKVG